MLNYLFLLFVSLNKIKRYSYIFMGNIAGYDNRNITVNNEINIKDLKILFNKNTMLKELETSENSIITKLELLTNNELIKPFNIFNGGLYKNWDFEL
jgi:hypothetical protein